MPVLRMGGLRQRTNWKDLAAVQVAWPGDEAVFVLSEKITGLRDAVEARLRENEMLAAMREALLPQLMSGKLRVKDAEKTVEEVL
ncbi:MAG: type I restriction endonuclease subunit S [Actinobacteria bacterium]|nr:type I restriction endonuclease subunit S [Actinomycetota bacterium]